MTCVNDTDFVFPLFVVYLFGRVFPLGIAFRQVALQGDVGVNLPFYAGDCLRQLMQIQGDVGIIFYLVRHNGVERTYLVTIVNVLSSSKDIGEIFIAVSSRSCIQQYIIRIGTWERDFEFFTGRHGKRGTYMLQGDFCNDVLQSDGGRYFFGLSAQLVCVSHYTAGIRPCNIAQVGNIILPLSA